MSPGMLWSPPRRALGGPWGALWGHRCSPRLGGFAGRGCGNPDPPPGWSLGAVGNLSHPSAPPHARRSRSGGRAREIVFTK